MDEATRQATRLWTKTQPVVSAFVASAVRDFQDRDDVLQEIAVAALDSFEESGSGDQQAVDNELAFHCATYQHKHPDRSHQNSKVLVHE